MQQVKIFKSVANELEIMEREINSWIAKSNVNVLTITGNISSPAAKSGMGGGFNADDVLIVVLYETKS